MHLAQFLSALSSDWIALMSGIVSVIFRNVLGYHQEALVVDCGSRVLFFERRQNMDYRA